MKSMRLDFRFMKFVGVTLVLAGRCDGPGGARIEELLWRLKREHHVHPPDASGHP